MQGGLIYIRPSWFLKIVACCRKCMCSALQHQSCLMTMSLNIYGCGLSGGRAHVAWSVSKYRPSRPHLCKPIRCVGDGNGGRATSGDRVTYQSIEAPATPPKAAPTPMYVALAGSRCTSSDHVSNASSRDAFIKPLTSSAKVFSKIII